MRLVAIEGRHLAAAATCLARIYSNPDRVMVTCGVEKQRSVPPLLSDDKPGPERDHPFLPQWEHTLAPPFA